ncbi:Peptidylprolyl isomerase [Flagellimonas maritima]|uniref:Peptidyl-prolyl cis-trans isomerase n=1 Tax=Flagellimonas maritima TaxID=1383885 RepID=A0A2Z4LV68_9FLAO|nr:peptidylprolyl isomerase [Allomuricauda aurantiaca]AWX45629.1 Peptidylprolyl isomerase [Allomuricauda aurantiaca]
MILKQSALLTSILLFFVVACGESPKNNRTATKKAEVQIDTTKENGTAQVKEEKDTFLLSEENAIDFFFEYAKNLKVDKVKLTTSMGSFTVQLYDDVPYHKANFIYLTRKGYFDNTQFHRIVKDFIIQGGNSDDIETPRKRNKIGKYLLPPDAKKGHKHHRGTISMPSSERDNPHKLASPYEFFIVVKKTGSYHLDGSYTPFGRVIQGMDVVDAISNVPVGDGDWPWQNVYILKAEVL